MGTMKTVKAIGVDFGGTSIKIGVTCGSEVLAKAEPLPTQEFDSPKSIMAAMCGSIRGLLREHPDATAVGLGMPGWVDFYKGILYQLTNVPVWSRQEPVREIMEAELGLPIVLDNDANCMAYGEWKLGAGRGMENITCLTLGTGIGGGMVVNNRMLRARNVSCAELGQTSIDYRGKVGTFGNLGAVEEYIGNNEIAAYASERYKAIGQHREPADCTPYALSQLAAQGDALAVEIYREVAEKLACMMMNVMYAFAPEAFILGGGVAKAGDLLFKPLEECLRRQLFPVHAANLRILPAAFGADSGLIGAGLMAAHYADGSLE